MSLIQDCTVLSHGVECFVNIIRCSWIIEQNLSRYIKKFEALFEIICCLQFWEKYLFENFPAMNIYQMNNFFSFPWNCSTFFIRCPLQYVVYQCHQLLSGEGPRITQILVLEKIRATRNLRNWNCSKDWRNVKFPLLTHK